MRRRRAKRDVRKGVALHPQRDGLEPANCSHGGPRAKAEQGRGSLATKARRGAKKAILAVAASMLTAAYFMLRDGVEYEDLGPDHFDRHDKTKTIRRLLKRLADLGCNFEPTPHPA